MGEKKEATKAPEKEGSLSEKVSLDSAAVEEMNKRNKKFLAFFIITIIFLTVAGAALFSIQSTTLTQKLGLTPKSVQKDITIDQILIKTLISGEEATKQLKVMNSGSTKSAITIEAANLADLIKFSESSFQLEPGQTKTIDLTFASKVKESNILHSPGIYAGKIVVKSPTNLEEIPTVIEVESSPVLFDINLNVPLLEKEIVQGKSLITETKIFNLQNIGQTSVKVFYSLTNLNGNTIITEEETIGVGEQATASKIFSIPDNIKPGVYVLSAKASYGSSVGTASYIFEIKKSEGTGFVSLCKKDTSCQLTTLIVVLTLLSFLAYAYFFIRSREFYKAHKKIVDYHLKIEEKPKIDIKPKKKHKIAKTIIALFILLLLIVGGIAAYLWTYNPELMNQTLSGLIKAKDIILSVAKNLPYEDWQFYIPAGVIVLVFIWVVLISSSRKEKRKEKAVVAEPKNKEVQKSFFARWKAKREKKRKEKLERKKQKIKEKLQKRILTKK